MGWNGSAHKTNGNCTKKAMGWNDSGHKTEPKITQKNASWVLCAVYKIRTEEEIARLCDRASRSECRSSYPLVPSCMDGVATKILAAVAAVVAAAACFRRLRAQFAATTREIGELCDKLAQQQAPPEPPAPVAQAK